MLLAEVMMKSMAVRDVATAMAVVAVVLCSSLVQSIQSTTAPSPDASVKPLVLEKNEGEVRTRRIHTDATTPASSQFILKVSPKNNGSQHLVAGMEELAPGAAIPRHRHLTQDEILLVQSGMGHVWLGDQERDLHAGGLVFIPANTWVSLKNTGAEPISLTFIFSAPGFEDTMRCNSVPAGETPTRITPEEQKECAHLGHAENANRPEQPRK
jgi:quercetin dioxygenase-like cupin family protein